MYGILNVQQAPLLTLPTVGNQDLLAGLAGLGTEGFNLLDDIHALDDLSEDDVLSVQPLSLGGAQEKLTAVGVGAGVSHRQNSGSCVLEGEVLVLELVSVDGLASGSVSASEVAALAHELRDHAVERAANVSEVRVARSAEVEEVLGGSGYDIGSQGHFDAPGGSSPNRHVEENHRVGHVCSCNARRFTSFIS